ncbi:hypothetical protein D3C79_828640 [compost metagenome]
MMNAMVSPSCRLLSADGRRRAVSAGMTKVMADMAVKWVATMPPAISRLAPYFRAWCKVPLPLRKRRASSSAARLVSRAMAMEVSSSPVW